MTKHYADVILICGAITGAMLGAVGGVFKTDAAKLTISEVVWNIVVFALLCALPGLVLKLISKRMDRNTDVDPRSVGKHFLAPKDLPKPARRGNGARGTAPVSVADRIDHFLIKMGSRNATIRLGQRLVKQIEPLRKNQEKCTARLSSLSSEERECVRRVVREGSTHFTRSVAKVLSNMLSEIERLDAQAIEGERTMRRGGGHRR